MTDECAGPKKIKISWSALQSHEFCPRQAALRAEKRKSPGSNIRTFFHGTVCDRTMMRWLNLDDPRPGQMASWIDEMIDACLDEAKNTGDGVVKWRSSTDRAEMSVWCQELVSRLEPMLLQWVIPFDYQPDYRFRIPINIPYLDGGPAQIYLSGAMDILVREQEGPPAIWTGFDLKATANPDYLRKTLGQGIFYDLAVRADPRTGKGTSPRTFAFLQPMVENNPVAHVKITDADRNSLLARIVKMAHAIWRDETEPKQGSEGCSFCQVRHACSKFAGTNKDAVWTPKLGKRSAARQEAASA